MKLAIMMLVLAACEPPWLDGTEVTATTSRAGMPLDAWSLAVDDALAMWQDEIGADCPIGIVHVQGARGPRSRKIELVAPADWTHGYDTIGKFYSDSGIEVYGTSPDDTEDFTFGTLVHELGHALAGPDHSSDPTDIMSPNGGTTDVLTFTPATIERVRGARGCPSHD